MNSPSRSLALQTWYVYTAGVLICSLLVWAINAPGFILKAHASQLSSITDTISTSRPGVGANHTIRFTTSSGVPADGSTIELTIPSGFSMGTLGEDDIDIEDDGADLTTGDVCGAVQAAVSVSGQIITIEICTGGGGAIGATSEVTIEIGTHADASGTGSQQITNHATQGSYALLIGGTMEDEGATRVVIVDPVTVTGNVDTYLSFVVDGVDAGETVNGDATVTIATTTATSVPFGTVAPATEYVLAQDLAVVTNTRSGFSVALLADGDLVSTSGATINSFTDGTGTSTPIAWTAPSAQSGSPDTYGHWGITTEDISLSDDDSFGDALYVGDFVGTPREVMYATSSADGTTEHIGTTRVGYKLEISTLQEASSDYSTRVAYIVTPIF